MLDLGQKAESTFRQSIPVGTEQQQEKTVRLLYKNGFRMSRGLDDNFIEKGENETNRDF